MLQRFNVPSNRTLHSVIRQMPLALAYVHHQLQQIPAMFVNSIWHSGSSLSPHRQNGGEQAMCLHLSRGRDPSRTSAPQLIKTPPPFKMNLFVSPHQQKPLLYYKMKEILVKVDIFFAWKLAMVVKHYKKHQKRIEIKSW